MRSITFPSTRRRPLTRKSALAALLAAGLLAGAAHAQPRPQPAGHDAGTAQTQATAPASVPTVPGLTPIGSGAQPLPGAQQGIVYPGQPITPSVGAGPGGRTVNVLQPPTSRDPRAQQSIPIAEMPALPGESRSALRQAAEDAVPPDLARELREMRRRLDDVQKASISPATAVPKPSSSTITVTQSPGEDPPVVRTAVGVPTNLVFVDATGAPWPVDFATPGIEGYFDILIPVAGSSVVQVRPRVGYAYSGLAVTLRGNPIPLSISLTSAQREVDTRLDIRIARRGPNAQAAIIDRGDTTGTEADPVLMAILDGVPPADAKEVKSSTRTVRAWQRPDGRLYLRTAVPVLSPAWTDSNSSPDGMRAYAMPMVPTVMISVDGVPTMVGLGD